MPVTPPAVRGVALGAVLVFALTLLLGMAAGCAPARAPAPRPETTTTRPVDGAPDRFVWAVQPDGSVTMPTIPGTTCLNPMTDPRDGTKLILIRSRDGLGDYEVPAGRYGVGADELLRVECGSGRPVGIVKR